MAFSLISFYFVLKCYFLGEAFLDHHVKRTPLDFLYGPFLPFFFFFCILPFPNMIVITF